MRLQTKQSSVDMQRDMDLIREMLLKIEDDPPCDGHLPQDIYIAGRPAHDVDYHLRLLDEAGYIKGTSTMGKFLVSSMTWDGHEFIANIKDATIWDRAKEKAKEIPDVSLKIIREIAANLIRTHFHLP